MITLTTIALALGIGGALGLLGGGGSIIAVPALTFALHLSTKDAIATSLAVVGFVAAAGAISAFVRGVLPAAAAMRVGLPATLGAYGGGVIGAQLPDRIQLSILAAVMLAAALVLWRRPAPAASASGDVRPYLLMSIGLGVGVLTGLVGVGGGFLMVPALVVAARLPMPKAAAASLFAIALAAVSAAPRYMGDATLAWRFIVPFALIAAAGAMAGGMVAPRLPQQRLQQAFAVTLVILGSYVLISL
jgi:uncharacterized membrane protein YfcA